MRLRLPGSIKGMVTLIVMLSLLPVLGIIAVTGYNKAQNDLRVLGEEALHSAGNILRRQGQLVESTRTLLLILSDLPEVRERNVEACEKLFQKIMLHEPAYANIRLLDERGATIVSGKPETSSLSPLERRQLLGAAHRGFAVRELTQRQEEDLPSFVCVFPIQAGKRTQAVLMADIHIIVTKAELSGLAAKHVAHLHLVNKNGHILYGYPSRDPDPAIEARERQSLWRQIRDSSAPSGMLLTSAGRHIFYEKIASPGSSVPDLTAIVVIAGSTILSRSTERYKSSGLLLGGLLLAAIFTALRLSNISLLAPMKALLHTARQIR